MSFMSWLPGTQRAVPACDHVPHEPQRVEDPRATIHQVAQEDRLAALGMPIDPAAPDRIVFVAARSARSPAAEQGLQFVAAAVHVADDVERAVLVPLVVPQRHPLDRGRLDLLGRFEDEDVAEAFALAGPASTGAAATRCCADDVRPEVAVLPAAVPLLADLLGQVEHDGHRQAVVLPGQRHQRLAGLRLDVRGIHDRQSPSASRLAAMKCSTSKASFVTVWSFSSSQTSPRQASDDSTSVGRKCFRAKVLLPEPDGPMRTTSDNLGTAISMTRASLAAVIPGVLYTGKNSHLRRRAELGVFRSDRQEADSVAEPIGDAAGPGLELCPRPLEAVVAVAELARRQVLEQSVVLPVGVVSTRSPAWRTRRALARRPPAAADRDAR